MVIFRRKYVKPESQATAKHKWHRLNFDPNTMKLPDFLEALNQGAEKAFGENAKSMIDSLLNAKLPAILKQSVNMARLENGTYEEIVAHLERELELNTSEEPDDLPIATMASSSGMARNLLSNGIATNNNNQCSYCKAEDHFWKKCPKLKKKKEMEAKNEKNLNAQPIQNVLPAAKLITQQRNAGVVPVPTFVPKEIDRTPKIRSPLKTKALTPKTKNLQHLHQASPIQKSLIQKTNFATTPNM